MRNHAKGMPCQVRLPGHCNNDPETTVLAHLPSGSVASKSHDIFGAWACSGCHDVVDGRVRSDLSNDQIKIYFYEGVFRTLRGLMEQNLLGGLKWRKKTSL